MPNIKSLTSKPFYRYIIVGLSVYIFELLVIFTAQHYGASDILAVGLSFWLGLFASFGLQKFITFQDRRTHKKIVMMQFLEVALLVLWNFGFTLLVTALLRTHVNAVLSRTAALAITTIWNFYLYKTRIFNFSSSSLID